MQYTHYGVDRERGQAAVEWLIALPVVLLLLGGGLQFALVFTAKNTLDYATFKATRAATLDHGSIAAFKRGFARGITPLFPSGSGATGYNQALAQAMAAVNNPQSFQIKVLNPTSAVLQPTSAGGWVETVTRENGQSVQEIPNSRLLYTAAQTTHAGETLQAANLLKIRMSYCYHLWVPFVSEVIGKMMSGKGSSFDQQCYANGGLPVAAVSTQLMQSSIYPQKVTDLAAPANTSPTLPTNGGGAKSPGIGACTTTPVSSLLYGQS